MITRIHCATCGPAGMVPLEDQEDIANGWQSRAVWLTAHKPDSHFIQITNSKTGEQTRTDLPNLVYDGCNGIIADGDRCVAMTMWRGQTPPAWESQFGTPESTP
jgi:hypothetical protein